MIIGILNLLVLVSIVEDLPPDARGPLRRGRAGGAAQQPRLHEPLLQAGDERGQASPGRCTRSASCSASASTPRPRSRCSRRAGAAAAGGLPIYAILCLPILFAAGMSLLDTIDGAFMNFAYGWAFSKPVRKIFYNMTITWLSVVVALVIGTIELMSVLADKLSLDRPALGLRLRPRPELRRLRDRRDVRPHLGGRAGDLALRSHRGALVGGDVADRVAGVESRTSVGGWTMTDSPQAEPLEFETIDEVLDDPARARAPGLNRVPAGAGGAVRRRRPGLAQFIADALDRAGLTPGPRLRLSKPRAAGAARRRQARPPRPRPGPLHAGRRRREGVPGLRALRPGDQRRSRPSSTRCAPPDPQAIRLRGAVRPLPDHRTVRRMRRRADAGRAIETARSRTRTSTAMATTSTRTHTGTGGAVNTPHTGIERPVAEGDPVFGRGA